MLGVVASVVPRHLSLPGFASPGHGSALRKALRIHLLNGTNSDVEDSTGFSIVTRDSFIYINKFLCGDVCSFLANVTEGNQGIHIISGRFFTWYNVYTLCNICSLPYKLQKGYSLYQAVFSPNIMCTPSLNMQRVGPATMCYFLCSHTPTSCVWILLPVFIMVLILVRSTSTLKSVCRLLQW